MMDETDVRIVKMLADDGRLPNSEIARRLKVSEGMVRQRIKRLIEAGDIRIQAMVNASNFPSQYLAVIGLNIEGRQLEQCAERINSFSEVRRCMIITGRFDILVSVLLHSHESLVEFVTKKLSTVPGIRNSETFVCLKNYDVWLPVSYLRQSESVDGPAERKNHHRKIHPKKS